jgi:hypothetical protein
MAAPLTEPLGVLLLPCRLEEFSLAAQARDLLAIPRVIALEAPRRRPPRFLRDSVAMRQSRRLRLPGEPRVLVLYHPAQYRLARALRGRYANSELWYMSGDAAALTDEQGHTRQELLELDALARQRATETRVVAEDDAPAVVNEALRVRLHELEIISTRPFVPGARVGRPGERFARK